MLVFLMTVGWHFIDASMISSDDRATSGIAGLPESSTNLFPPFPCPISRLLFI